MAIEYRTIRSEEQEQAIALWSAVLGEDSEVRKSIFCDFADDPNRFHRTYVAVTSDGTLCAAMSYWVRDIRDDQGKTQRVGHLWGAATLPAYRQQGHATQLINRIIDSMKQEGCTWSILFARDQARPLYERLGWQGFETSYSGGLIAVDHLLQTSNFNFHLYDPFKSAQGWTPLGTVYNAYNATRPLSLIRSSQYWDGYLAWMANEWITHNRAAYWVLTPKENRSDIVAYALIHYYDKGYAENEFGSPPWFHVSEIGLSSPDPQIADELVNGIAAEAIKQNIFYGHFALPSDETLSTALGHFFNQPLNTESERGSMMARPLVEEFAGTRLSQMFGVPNALFWEIDRY